VARLDSVNIGRPRPNPHKETSWTGIGKQPTLEPVEGTSLVRVTLTSHAAERVGVQTVPVRDAGSGNEKVVPTAR